MKMPKMTIDVVDKMLPKGSRNSRKWIKENNLPYHVLLLLTFITYIFVGGAIFYAIESNLADKIEWRTQLSEKRSSFVERDLMPALFNNSLYMIFIDSEQSFHIEQTLKEIIAEYENRVGVSFDEQAYDWTYWNSVMYACTVLTTIGFGHMHPVTSNGKIATMVYLVVGLPMLLCLLRTTSRLFSTLFIYPSRVIFWCWTKLRNFSKPSTKSKKGVDEVTDITIVKRHQKLIVLDIPIALTIISILVWFGLGSTIFFQFEKKNDWTLLESVYFVFNCITTLGLPYPVPRNDTLLLAMFIFIFIGLALLTTLFNLVHARCAATCYEVQTPNRQLTYSLVATSHLQARQQSETEHTNTPAFNEQDGTSIRFHATLRITQEPQPPMAVNQTNQATCVTLGAFHVSGQQALWNNTPAHERGPFRLNVKEISPDIELPVILGPPTGMSDEHLNRLRTHFHQVTDMRPGQSALTLELSQDDVTQLVSNEGRIDDGNRRVISAGTRSLEGKQYSNKEPPKEWVLVEHR